MRKGGGGKEEKRGRGLPLSAFTAANACRRERKGRGNTLGGQDSQESAIALSGERRRERGRGKEETPRISTLLFHTG